MEVVPRRADAACWTPAWCATSIENQDTGEHRVGLRFLLDTFIGTNDGVPFTIPGRGRPVRRQEGLHAGHQSRTSSRRSRTRDLANPGTVAHLKLKLGGNREPPSRVTLGAWPDDDLQTLLHVSAGQGAGTLWDVPVLPMKTLLPVRLGGRDLLGRQSRCPPGGRREVGFAYGLGSVSSSGKLLLTVDGSFKPGGELTVTALVEQPGGGRDVDADRAGRLPDRRQCHAEGAGARPRTRAAATGRSPGRSRPGRSASTRSRCESSTGDAQSQTVNIKASSIFD